MTQLRKNVLAMAVLAVLAGGAGLYAWLGVMKGDEAEQKRKAESSKLVSLGDDSGSGSGADAAGASARGFKRIALTARGERTVLERHDGEWRIVEPVVAPVDKVAVDGLVTQLLTGQIKEALEEKPSPEDLRKYGLDQPRFEVTATVEVPGGTKELVLKGGVENTFDGSVYLLRGDDGKVYSAPGGLRWSLEKTTWDLRDKEVLAVPDAKLTRVEVKAPNHAYTLMRNAEKKAWRVTTPKDFTADAKEVTSLATSLKNQRAIAFHQDSAGEREKLRIDEPAAVATFTLESGEQIRLTLGQVEVDGTKKVYALREDGHETALAEVPSSALGALDRDPMLLRDKSVLTFEKDQVDQLVFKDAKGLEIAVQRVRNASGATTEDWKLVRPAQGPAKKFKLASILWMLGSLKAQTFGEENPKNWSKWGLDKPTREVLLLDKAARTIAHLRVGAEVPGKENVRYMRGTRDQVLEVDTERLKDLPDAVDILLDRPAPAAEAGSNP
ncbi:MAG: DUF4340 domain-containing protein [Myxococcaceae bacterium]